MIIVLIGSIENLIVLVEVEAYSSFDHKFTSLLVDFQAAKRNLNELKVKQNNGSMDQKFVSVAI